MKQTLLAFRYSDDFSDRMDDAEQQPDDQCKPSDKATHNEIDSEDADCGGDPISEGDKPKAHPLEAEGQTNTDPHQ